MNFETPKHSELKQHLNIVNNRIGVLVIVGTVISVCTVDFLFKLTLVNVPLVPFAIAFAIVSLCWLTQIFNRTQNKVVTAVNYVTLNAVAFYALAFLFPLPSPYFFFVMVLPLLIYFDLGVKASYVCMTLWGVAMSVRFAEAGLIMTKSYILFLIYYATTISFFDYIVNFLKIANDERRALEKLSEQTELERRRLLTLVNNLNDAVIACDTEFNILVSNPQALKLLDEKDELVGKNINNLVTLTDAKGQKVKLSELLAKNPDKFINVFTSYKLYYTENDFVNLYIAVSKIQSGQDANSGYVLLLRDITKLKSLEDERDEFISIMSHELRTPVSIVEGGISLAQLFGKKGGMDTKAEQYLDKAHVQALMLAEIVNSLSTLVHSEQGGTKFSLKEVDPKTIADRLYTTYQPQIAAKGLKTVVQLDANLPLMYTNEEATFEILQNFLTNAIKYTKKGTVTLTISRKGEKHVAFAVTDSGIGMSKSDQEHVFDKFWRSENFQTRESGGTGLGLYITKKLASKIGAKIELKSELEKGTTFTLVMPLHGSIESIV